MESRLVQALFSARGEFFAPLPMQGWGEGWSSLGDNETLHGGEPCLEVKFTYNLHYDSMLNLKNLWCKLYAEKYGMLLQQN